MLYKRNPQLNQHGELIHLLSTEGLPRDIVTHILDTAANFVSVNDRGCLPMCSTSTSRDLLPAKVNPCSTPLPT